MVTAGVPAPPDSPANIPDAPAPPPGPEEPLFQAGRTRRANPSWERRTQTRKAPKPGLSRSGRRDLNSGPQVPQTCQAKWSPLAGRGGNRMTPSISAS